MKWSVRKYRTFPDGFYESKETVIQGGTIAKIAKEQIEKASGKKIVSNKNAIELRNEKKRLTLEEQNGRIYRFIRW